MRKFGVLTVIILVTGFNTSTLWAQQSTLDSLQRAFEAETDPSKKIELLLKFAFGFEQTNPDSLITLSLQAAEIANNNGLDSLKVIAEIQAARGYMRAGSFSSSLSLSEEILNYIDQQNSQRFELERANVIRTIGNIYFIQFEQEKSLDFYKEAEPVFLKYNDFKNLTALYDNMASTYLELALYPKAEEYYLKALHYYENYDVGRSVGRLYVNLANLYQRLGNFSKTKDYALKALEYAEAENALIMKTYCYRMLGNAALYEENYEEAIDYNLKSLEIANELDIVYEQKDSYLNLSKIYEEMGDFEKAYYNYVEHKTYYDSLQNEQSNNRLAELRTKYEVDKIEQEKALLEKENQLKSTRIAAVSVIFGVLLILLIVGILGFVSRKRKEIELLEKDKIIANSKKQLAEEELANVRLREENLQKELTNYALHIVEKNDFLEEVKSQMADIKTDIKNDIAIKHINRIGNKIYQNLMLNKDREEFEIQVEQACSGFFKSLESKHPELTNQERRLAALLRLNLSSKEISGILNISPKSVDQSRYRLRKKINVEKEINLANYFNQI